MNPVSEEAEDVRIRQQFGKVSLPHPQRRNRNDVVGAFSESIAFVVEEEKRAVPEPVNVRSTFAEVWQCNWTTDVESKIVLIVACTLDPLRVAAKCVCIQFLVSDEVVDLTVIIIPTTLLREVNDTAG